MLFAAGTALLLVVPVSAQSIPREPEPAQVRARLGPLLLNPTFALTNAGVDTNVFNEADAASPERDFTITLTPAVDWWLQMGRTWLVGNVSEGLVWYETFASERSANSSATADWLVPLNRLRFSVGGSWTNTRERPGFEIDTRAGRHEKGVDGAVEFEVLSRMFLGARGERRTIEFDQDAVFLGRSLETELSRTVTTAAITVRSEVTPLTSVSFAAGRHEERFTFSPLRDSDSTTYDFSLAFEPLALINGSAQIGFRDFKPVSRDLPGYRGSTALVNLSQVVLGTARVGLAVERDIRFSYDVNQPYYLQTGMNVSLAQRIYGPFEVEFRIGGHRLEYVMREGTPVQTAADVDRIRTYGFGVGYRLGSDLRVGFNVDRQRRTSLRRDHEYEGLRYGFGVTYGL